MIDANGESVKEPVTATPAEEVDDEVQEPAYKRLKASSIDPVTGVEQTRVAGMQKRLKAFLQKRAPDFKTLSETEYLELKKDAPKLTLLEALSATGLRSIRYAKEIDHIGTVIANDMEPAAVQAIQSNVIYNGLQEIVKPNEDNALHVFYKAMMDGSTKFDVIDLDPYGSATPFLDGAMQTVQENGFLCVTCTDMAVLAGSQSEACWIKYGAMSMPNAPYCHELGLRILLHSMQASAAKYKKIIEPFMSCSIDFYVRVFVRVRTSGALVKKAASLTSVVYHCGACKHFVPQPMGKCVETVTQKGGLSSKFGPARGPTANTNCEICGGVTHVRIVSFYDQGSANIFHRWRGPVTTVPFITKTFSISSSLALPVLPLHSLGPWSA